MKNKIINIISNELEDKILVLKSDIKSLIDSRNNDTKSSAGDKYETGREMAQIELNKLESLLTKTQILQQEITKIDPKSISKNIEFGTLVMSNQENYFISISMSKIEVDGILIYPITLASPIGMALKGKHIGDSISFRGREITIQNIY